MTTYNDDEVERLIAERMYDEETIKRATQILQAACSRDIRERRSGDLQLVAHVLRDALAARAAMADQLEAARTEIERLRDRAKRIDEGERRVLADHDEVIAERDAALAEVAQLRPIVEAVAGAAVDQTIGSVKVYTVGERVTAQYLPVAAAEAVRNR